MGHLQLTMGVSALVAVLNAVMGVLIAWVLVRDHFWGKRLVDAVIDLPFALPTIVAGLVLVGLYGPKSPIGVDIAYTRLAVAVALAFVTLPFVVRTVQPVLIELDTDMEEAAASLGAGNLTVFRRVVLPNLVPAIVAGATLSFARAIAEFGSTVLISGNVPFETEVASVFIYGQHRDRPEGHRRGGVHDVAVRGPAGPARPQPRPALERPPWLLAGPWPEARARARSRCASWRCSTSRSCS